MALKGYPLQAGQISKIRQMGLTDIYDTTWGMGRSDRSATARWTRLRRTKSQTEVGKICPTSPYNGGLVQGLRTDAYIWRIQWIRALVPAGICYRRGGSPSKKEQ